MVAFLIWVTLNKHLGNYFADLGLGSSSASATGTIGAAGAGVAGEITSGSGIFKPGSLFDRWFGPGTTGGATGTTGGL
jgi:hypothetical protein